MLRAMKPLQFLTESMRLLELLAPARNAEIARTAILAGADAVYIGAPAFERVRRPATVSTT